MSELCYVVAYAGTMPHDVYIVHAGVPAEFTGSSTASWRASRRRGSSPPSSSSTATGSGSRRCGPSASTSTRASGTSTGATLPRSTKRRLGHDLGEEEDRQGRPAPLEGALEGQRPLADRDPGGDQEGQRHRHQLQDARLALRAPRARPAPDQGLFDRLARLEVQLQQREARRVREIRLPRSFTHRQRRTNRRR